MRLRYFGALCAAAALTLCGPAHADAFLDITLMEGQPVSVTYTGPEDALATGTFSAVGEIGGTFFVPPDGEIWTWEALGPFGSEVCGRSTIGQTTSCTHAPFIELADGTQLLSITVGGRCLVGDPLDGGSPCTGFSVSPFGDFTIDVPSADPGDLFLTPTPLPDSLPLLTSAFGAMGLLRWRRKRRVGSVEEMAGPAWTLRAAAILATALVSMAPHQAHASSYNINVFTDPGVAGTGGSLSCSPLGCAPGFASAIYSVQPGDIVNFGTVTIFEDVVGVQIRGPNPGFVDAILIPDFSVTYNSQPLGALFDELDLCPTSGPSSCSPTDFDIPPLVVDLTFTIPDGDTSIQVAWTGPFDYLAAPLPDSILLFMSGLVLIGLSRSRVISGARIQSMG